MIFPQLPETNFEIPVGTNLGTLLGTPQGSPPQKKNSAKFETGSSEFLSIVTSVLDICVEMCQNSTGPRRTGSELVPIFVPSTTWNFFLKFQWGPTWGLPWGLPTQKKISRKLKQGVENFCHV